MESERSKIANWGGVLSLPNLYCISVSRSDIPISRKRKLWEIRIIGEHDLLRELKYSLERTSSILQVGYEKDKNQMPFLQFTDRITQLWSDMGCYSTSMNKNWVQIGKFKCLFEQFLVENVKHSLVVPAEDWNILHVAITVEFSEKANHVFAYAYNYKLFIHIPTAISCDPNGIATLRRQIWKAHMILFQGKIWITRLRFNLQVAITVEFSEKANHDFAMPLYINYNYKL